MRLSILASLFLIACESESLGECEAYVDYMCNCHPDEDCNALSNQYENPTTEDEADCADLYDEQKTEDGTEESDECPSGTEETEA